MTVPVSAHRPLFEPLYPDSFISYCPEASPLPPIRQLPSTSQHKPLQSLFKDLLQRIRHAKKRQIDIPVIINV